MPRLDGIDVSHYQGIVDWPTVAAIPTFWAACKFTQSVAYLDPTAATNRNGMASAGLRYRGLYHWLSPATDPTKQAAWFTGNVHTLAAGEFAMCDAEEAGVTEPMVVAWCETVEAATHRPCAVYTGAYVAGGSIWTSPRVRTSWYGPRPMVLAAYTTEAKAKALPGVAAYPWHSWQFSSDGPVPGVVGRCDMNRVDDRDVYDVACGLDTKPPPPVHVEDDMPAVITNSQPHTFTDGQTYQPAQVYWEVTGGCKVHIANGTILKAYGGPSRAVAMDENELVAIPDLEEHDQVKDGPLTLTGAITSVPGPITLTAAS